MNQIIDFIKDNIELCIVVAAIFVVLLVALIFFFKRPKSVADKIKFEKNMERIEKRFYKKCKHCKENVPQEDNICMSCGEIPN